MVFVHRVSDPPRKVYYLQSYVKCGYVFLSQPHISVKSILELFREKKVSFALYREIFGPLRKAGDLCLLRETPGDIGRVGMYDIYVL